MYISLLYTGRLTLLCSSGFPYHNTGLQQSLKSNDLLFGGINKVTSLGQLTPIFKVFFQIL